MAQVIIKPFIAFKQGDTFVFDSWVCIANGAGSFQRYLTPTSEKKPAPATLTQASLEDLTENFSEVSLSHPIKEHEPESEYFSTSTHTWFDPRELAPEPSCDSNFLYQQLLFGFHNATR